MVPTVEYIEWIRGRPDAVAHDLGSSGLFAATGENGVVPEELRGLDDPADGPDLRARLAERYGVDRGGVLLTAGATTANVVAAIAAAELGGSEDTRTGLVEKPTYEPLIDSPRLFGVDIDRFRRRSDSGYALDPERVDAAATEDTAFVTVTNRHNPSGRLADRETLSAVADAAAERDALLHVDEVYAPYVRDDGDGPFGGVTAAGLPDTVVTGSLTKFFGLDGLRAGWVVGDPEVVDAARSAATHFADPSTPSVALAERALEHADELAASARERVAANHDLLADFVAGRDDLDGRVFADATYAFLDPRGVDGSTVTEAALERDLLVVPGRFFEDEERFRVGLGCGPERMRAALNVLGETLDDVTVAAV